MFSSYLGKAPALIAVFLYLLSSPINATVIPSTENRAPIQETNIESYVKSPTKWKLKR